ncbi:MAG TPA: Flp pilus assembly protein CpaB [Rhizomicrobium sp.]|nr:Flp pilus assembly protein CpaB [Rhizomicrobium sp.]
MDRRRLVVVGLAAFAAIAAIFLMRALLGGGTTKVVAAPQPKVETTEVLVSSGTLSPGTKLEPSMVHWQEWPKKSVDSSFLTHEAVPDVAKFAEKAVVRAPLVSGEPVTDTKVVQSDTAGFMAATLTPGMRAVSVGISTETGAGGFILPNDRVDVMKTDLVSDNPRRYRTSTILENVRVLSIDQTSREDKDQKYVVGKTATLELTPDQAKLIARASASGTLTLALRSLAIENKDQTAREEDMKSYGAGDVQIIRYGIVRAEAAIQNKE